MKTNLLKRSLSLVLCLVLVAAIALFTASCSGNNEKETSAENSATVADTSKPAVSSVVSSTDESEAESSEAESDGKNHLGEGATEFNFKFTDLDGKTTEYVIKTDKKTVGEALLELELIAGEEGQYGLYVKTVGGITLDYDKDGKYWAFYVGGEYAMTGVDSTDITAGETYEFKAE